MKRVWKEILALIIPVAACCLMLGYYLGTAAPSGSYQISGAADTQQYELPSEQPRETEEPSAEPVVPAETFPAVININTAGLEALMSLPGIGEVRANAILTYRENNGPFKSIEELLLVDGIGQGTLEEIRDRITLED